MGESCVPNLMLLPFSDLMQWCTKRQKHLGWTNQTLADKSKVPVGTINRIKAGEYLGLYNGALFDNGEDVKKILTGMAEKVNEEGKEFVTIFYGADISEKDANNTALPIFEKICPDAEISLIYGGQPVYYYLISAE